MGAENQSRSTPWYQQRSDAQSSVGQVLSMMRAPFLETGQRFRYGFSAACGESLPGERDMSDWLHGLPVLWMAILVFGLTYLVTAGIYAAIAVFAVGERARSFKAVAPGLLSLEEQKLLLNHPKYVRTVRTRSEERRVGKA